MGVDSEYFRIANKHFKNHVNLHEPIKHCFKLFIAGSITADKLILYLTFIEMKLKLQYKYPKDKNLWLRFFKNDTGATTIQNIKNDLELYPTHKNYVYMVENMKLALESNKNEFMVHFS